MINDEELRRRMREADPARTTGSTWNNPGRPIHEILERTMSRADLDTAAPTRRGHRLVLAGVGVAAVAAAGVALSFSGGVPGAAESALSTLALTATPTDPMSMCAPFSVDVLAEQPVALGGRVTDVSGEVATLTVDQWYRGPGDTQVTVTMSEGGAALDGVDLVVGEEYLLTATDGVVSTCGYSGVASPELESYYSEAFPA